MVRGMKEADKDIRSLTSCRQDDSPAKQHTEDG